MVRPKTQAPSYNQEDQVPYPESEGPYYISQKDEERPVRLPPSAEGRSPDKPLNVFDRNDIAQTPPTTICEKIHQACTDPAIKDNVVFAIEWPEPKMNIKDTKSLPFRDWKKWTYEQAYEEMQAVAKAFIQLGHEEREGVAILGFNSPFWGFASYGAILANGLSCGIYPTDTPDQIAYKASVCDASIGVVDIEENLNKFKEKLDDLPNLKAIVIWKDVDLVSGESGEELERSDGTKVKLLNWTQLLAMGNSAEDSVGESLKARIKCQKPGKCAALIFTSGTTGTPKAVMISHDNIVYQVNGTAALCPPSIQTMKVPIKILSYLPLSHIAGLYVDLMIPMCSFTDAFKPKITIFFARSYDLKIGSIVERLKLARPTFFVGVPRVYEKIAEKIKLVAPKKGPAKKIGGFAKRKNLKFQTNMQMGGNGKKPTNLGIAKKIIGAVHKKLGLNEVVFMASAAAPMKMDVLQYWGSLGFYVAEVYGMSENTGISTSCTMEYRQWGTVGFAAPGTDLKVFKVNPEDVNDKKECPRAKSVDDPDQEVQGEVCFRGRHIMLGYLGNPKLGEEHMEYIAKANRNAIDNEGYMHSGDKGIVLENGMVKITGRYKEIIIGAGGENIAPVPIEDDFKARCPAISNVMMVGDQRKYNCAVISLTCEGATGQSPGTDKLAPPTTEKTNAKTIYEATQDQSFIDDIIRCLNETNSNGKVIHNNAFKIQKFTILPLDFSIETGELTATQKLKRSVVAAQYSEQIQAMYDDEGSTFVQTLPAPESE